MARFTEETWELAKRNKPCLWNKEKKTRRTNKTNTEGNGGLIDYFILYCKFFEYLYGGSLQRNYEQTL